MSESEATDLMMAKERFVDFPSPGVPMPVPARAIARAGHPIVARNPGMWVPITVDYDLEPAKMADDTDQEVRQLKQELVGLGVDVDGRWSLTRLRREVEKARARG